MSIGDSPTALNKTRSTEWMLACLLLAWGINVLRTEVFFDLPTYRVMGAIMSESRWGMIAVIVGLVRMLGLAINGFWRRSPLIRFVGAVAGGMAWMSIAFLMYAATFETAARLPAGYFFYMVFFVFEGWCVIATGYDIHKNGSLNNGVVPRHVGR